ncbi:anti-sigma factor [Nocardiopsis composta]|uniref:Regulator of SigK n=1 Tax=Nocardiopsis composta TaxID=157465 RepID=A0A7W8VCL0_9ACTN|nr:anti-sigma factor [Nocardiopsis composta]MBB5431095.1 anti-sigma-K factor RskA [Nocardiopsis composta]
MKWRMRPDVHALAGAYALDALPADEQQRFERHLASCEACAEEVRGLAETAALLGEAAARTPPERLRGRVLEEAGRTRQPAPAPPRPAPPRPRWWQGGGGLVLAACLVVVLVLAGTAVVQQRRIAELERTEREMAAVLTAPDADTDSASPAPGVTVTVVSSRERGALVFSAHGLDRLEGEDYQLWLSDPGGGMRSAGVLAVGPDATAAPLLARDLGDAEGVAVTVEPAGGSDQPTGDPMMSMPLEG